MEELNGRMIAYSDSDHRIDRACCQLIRRIRCDFCRISATRFWRWSNRVRIAGALDAVRVRATAERTVDELFALMKPPSTDDDIE